MVLLTFTNTLHHKEVVVVVDILFDLLEKIAKSNGGPTTLMVIVIITILIAAVMSGGVVHFWGAWRKQKKENVDQALGHIGEKIDTLSESIREQTTALFSYHDDQEKRLGVVEGDIKRIDERCDRNHAA
jgi:hypothetical protein